MTNAIECLNLTHCYGSKIVYENLNFHVERGKIFGILGKNGMGKTTAINILMGFLRPTAGRCLVLGEESHRIRPETRARIGLLHEGHIQYDFMTITQIERFYAAFYPRWKRQYYYHLVDKLGLSGDHKIAHMSCGQRSQIALGLILAQDPDLMILDDYSMGLDAGYRHLFLDFLLDFVRTDQKTVLMTSHIIQDLENVIDDAIILGYQKLLAQLPVSTFRQTFHAYRFDTPQPVEVLRRESLIRNIETLKQHVTVFGFFGVNELEALLDKNGITHGQITEIPLSFEEAFIGITGKY